MKERETIDLENNGERAKQSGRGRSSPSSVPSRLAVIISRQTEEECVPCRPVLARADKVNGQGFLNVKSRPVNRRTWSFHNIITAEEIYGLNV